MKCSNCVDNVMTKQIIGTAVLVGVGIGVALFGGWVVRAAYLRWMFTQGFWQAIISDIQFSFGVALVVGVAQALPNIPKIVSGNKVHRVIHAVGAFMVALTVIYCAWPSFSFGRLCWWQGFFSSMYSLSAFAFALVAIGSSIAGVVLCIKAVLKK